ncbi:MAG TPA: ABC transporter substrate-binding protein [Beijerinckiaceae bacterium]|nr:ABC transporter substrate-binding protein [Beijerinckiaceae bacterium]
MDLLTVSGYSRRPPHLVAIHKGFFEKHGLDVRFHLVDLAPEHNREMAEGKWNITLSSADTMLARATQDGVDYVLFMQAEEGLNVQLVAQPEIRTLDDLRGTLIAADPVDSNFDLVRNKILRDHGIGETDYAIEIIGNTPIRAQAFLDKRVAAAMLTPPSTDKALAAGGHVLAQGADYIPRWPLACGWGLRRWVETNPDIVTRFVRAWSQAADWALDPTNRDETLALLMEHEGVTRPRAEEAYARIVPKGMVNPQALRQNIEIRIELGYMPLPHRPAEHFYDACYWSAATGLRPPQAAGMPRTRLIDAKRAHRLFARGFVHFS